MTRSAVLLRASISVVLLLFACSTLFIGQEHHGDPSHSWTYSGATGPEHWAELSPEFAECAKGKQESPIDITNPVLANLPLLHFSYRPSPLNVVDNGHTIMATYAPGSGITVAGKRYELQQLHFHHPSEETINGQRYDMVVHLVHKSSDGQFAVVAVLIKEGAPNPLISTLWGHLPSQKDEPFASSAITVQALELIPAKHTYYTYTGSLTTPPCTEGITWFVMDTPMTLSKAQIDKFAALYPYDARPTQPLNGRVVKHSR